MQQKLQGLMVDAYFLSNTFQVLARLRGNAWGARVEICGREGTNNEGSVGLFSGKKIAQVLPLERGVPRSQ